MSFPWRWQAAAVSPTTPDAIATPLLAHLLCDASILLVAMSRMDGGADGLRRDWDSGAGERAMAVDAQAQQAILRFPFTDDPCVHGTPLPGIPKPTQCTSFNRLVCCHSITGLSAGVPHHKQAPALLLVLQERLSRTAAGCRRGSAA